MEKPQIGRGAGPRYMLDLQVKWECNAHLGSVELFCNSAACVATEKPQTESAPVCATWFFGVWTSTATLRSTQ
jgi:hypothetical protein